MAASSLLILSLAAFTVRQSARIDDVGTIRVELTDATTPSAWTDPGVIVPILAAGVSLLGVLFVNYSSGKRLMCMEERRTIAAASERRMSELRAERREAYAQLVAWQHKVERNVEDLLPKRSEPWGAWVMRTNTTPVEPSEMGALRELISQSYVNGSPLKIWEAALEYANAAVAVRNGATYCLVNKDTTYFTYLHNIWSASSWGLPSRISFGIQEDLGITMGPLHIAEEIEALKIGELIKRLDRHRRPFPKTRNRVKWWAQRRVTALRKARPTA